MITFSGIHVTRTFGAPSIRDIAVQSMMLVRFGGAVRKFWPVGMHAMLVADLLPPALEHHGLLHDSPEPGGCGDVCRPFKTPEARVVEDLLLSRIYESQGLVLPTEEEHRLIKSADTRAVAVEGEFIGPRGFTEWWKGAAYVKDMEAEGALQSMLRDYHLTDVLDPDGKWPMLYESRLRRSIVRAQNFSAYASEVL